MRLLITFVLFLIPQLTLAQQSDHELVKQYNERYHILEDQLVNVLTVNELELLSKEILDLKLDYQIHSDLIDNAIYPNNFGASIRDLSQLTASMEHRLMVIANQQEQISALSNSLDSYRKELARNKASIQRLNKQIADASKRQENLNGLIAQYKTKLEQRDRMFVAIMDSILLDYYSIIEAGTGEETKNAQVFIQHNNLVHTIEGIIDENILVLNQENQLSAPDYIRMYSVMKRFEDFYNKVGQELDEIFKEDIGRSKHDEITLKLERWESVLETRVWSSLASYLGQIDSAVQPFESQEEFIKSLAAYINNQIVVKNKDPFKDSSDQNYVEFDLFWTAFITDQYGADMIDSDLMNLASFSEVDQRMDRWEETVKPRTFHKELIYGFGILLILTMGYVIYRLW